MTTLRLWVSSKQDFESGGEPYSTVTLTADYADGRNAEWAKFTPSAVLTMTVKDSVAKEFQLGQKVAGTLNFTIEPEAKSGTAQDEEPGSDGVVKAGF